jgi:hypothetical protein
MGDLFLGGVTKFRFGEWYGVKIRPDYPMRELCRSRRFGNHTNNKLGNICLLWVQQDQACVGVCVVKHGVQGISKVNS